MAKTTSNTQKRSTLADVVTREYTIHMHKLVFGRSLRKRAPHAIKAVKAFAQNAMGTKDVRIDPSMNKAVWSRGVKHTNHRIRVRISRKRNDDEDAKEKLYSYVTFVPTVDFKGKFISLLLKTWPKYAVPCRIYSFPFLPTRRKRTYS
jgi:large subunit ribosomal protein L31e